MSLTAAVQAALKEAAERAVMPHYQRLNNEQITAKAADDVVTVADIEAEKILHEQLAAILPEAVIVGEEAAAADPSISDRLSDALCWIIDPIDGTNNYAQGKPPFGLMVALAERGETIGGWIYDPLRQRHCHAEKGRGAFINGERVQSRSSALTPPIAAISLVFANLEERAQLMTHIAPHYSLVDIPRCAAEQYPRLVLGENDVTIFSRTLAWDHAAGTLFTNEAGGKVCRPDGRPYLVHEHMQRGLLGASTPALWDELSKRVTGMLADQP